MWEDPCVTGDIETLNSEASSLSVEGVSPPPLEVASMSTAEFVTPSFEEAAPPASVVLWAHYQQ